MTTMQEEVDDRFAGIDIDSLLSRTDHRPMTYGRKKALYEAPEFIQRLNGEETVLEGQSLCIECKIRGFPVPTLRWFKDDEEILDHPRIHVESNGKGGYSLIIDNVHKGDEAAYRCRAENVEGACSSFFFLSVKSKPKSQKKKDQKNSPNRRTVSFPPMFATIVEKVEEEEKQGKETQQLPPSPMTDFYYALTLKGRQSFPTFVGDWAYVDGGQTHKRRTDVGGNEDGVGTSSSVPNGDHNDANFPSTNQARLAARRSLRRSDLAARTEAKKEMEKEEIKKRETDEERRIREEKEKRLLEEQKKREDEMKMDIERKRRAETMRLRKKAREERLQKEQNNERKPEETEADEAKRKAEEKKKEEESMQREREKQEKQKQREEEIRKLSEHKRIEEIKQREEQDSKKKQEEARKQKIEEDTKQKVEEGRKQKMEEDRKKKAEEDRKKKEEEARKKKEEEAIKQKMEEARKQKVEDGRKEKEEQDRKRKEEQDRKKKEEQDKKLKEEQERKVTEDQDRIKKMAEDRKQKEEQYRKIKEEQDRKKKEEQDSKKKEEEDRRKKEEQDRKIKEEQDRKKKEEQERRKKEEEEKRKLEDAKRKEEDARKKREAEALIRGKEDIEKQKIIQIDIKKKQEEAEKQRRIEEDKKKQAAIKKTEEIVRKKIEAEEDRKKVEIKKTEEEKKRLENERKAAEEAKIQKEPLQATTKQSAQKSVLQKFAKHLDSKLEPNAILAPKPSATPGLIINSDKQQGIKQDNNKVELLNKAQLPVTVKVSSLDVRNQQDSRPNVPSEKKPDFLKVDKGKADKDVKTAENNIVDKEPNNLPRTWQQRELQSQKVSQDKKRLDELRQKDQNRVEELKQQELKRTEEMKQGNKSAFEIFKKGQQSQKEDLRSREQKQIEELRRKEQLQREELRQKEAKQREELHRKEEKQKQEMDRQKEMKIQDELKRNVDLSLKEELKLKGYTKPKEEIKLREELKRKEEVKHDNKKPETKLKPPETRNKSDVQVKETLQKEQLKANEKKQIDELKLKEEKQLADLRLKQKYGAKQDDSERKRLEREQEDLRREYKKEQMIKDQLWRQHEEEVNKRQQKEQEAKELRDRNKQTATDPSTDDEFQVKVYKRDYSFEEMRKRLESHVSGEVMDADELKYWDDILQKHKYSINDIKQVFDSVSQPSTERQSRSKDRKSNVDDADISRMKRSGSVTGIRQAFTQSPERLNKRSESQKRQKDEDVIKKSTNISEIRQQFLEIVKAQASSKKTQNLPGHREADITINRLKIDNSLAPNEAGRRSKSPTPFRLSPSPSPMASSPNEQPARPTTRTQVELSKIATNVAAKRASFYEQLYQNPATQPKSTASDLAQKRMSYHGRDLYGSIEIPTYKRAAGWSDDLEKPQDIPKPVQQQAPELSKISAVAKNTASVDSSTRLGSKDSAEMEDSSSKVRPFVYNSARTTARRGSTGSQTTESCDSSSDDDDVFSDQNQDVSIDEEDDDADGRPPRKKPLFYIADAAEMAGCCTPESVTAESIIVFNSKMHKDLGVAMGTDLENRENNNTLIDQGKEFLDNKQHMPEFSYAKLDNVHVANTIGFSSELRSNVENETALVENKGIDSSKIHLTEKQMESCSYVQYSPSLASENSDTIKYSETTTQQNVTRKRSHDLEKEDLSQDGTRLGQNTGIKITSTSPSIYVYDNKGDVTPPIIIELWDKDEDYTSHFQPINHLQPTSYPQSTNQLQPIHQAPRLLTTKSNKLTAEFSREEREPTPFFKTEDISSKDKASAGSSCLSEDYSRTEREPTPYFDAKTQQQSKIVAFPIAVPSRNTLSPETPKEFHREPTPFFENNNTRPILSSPESLNTSMQAKGTDSMRKDITSHNQNKELTNTLSLSLTVPIGSENKRDARESTPYYDEKNPYEYTHHPDHHFSEKKSLLVKQNSKEDDVPSSENPAHLSPHLQLAGSLPQTVQQDSRPALQQNLQQGITVCMPTKVYSENKANSDQSKLSGTKQGVAFLATRRPDTLVSKPLKTLEVKRELPALAIPTDTSPVLPQGSTQASASDTQLKTPIIQVRDHGGISRGKAESLKTASSISGQQARSTPLPVSQVKLSSTAVVNKSVKDGAETVNTSCKLVQDSAETVNKSNKLAQGSADTISSKSSKSVHENSQAVNTSCKLVQDSAETVNKSTKLAQGSAETVNKSTKLAQGSAETVNKSTKLAQGSAETVNKSTKLAQGSAEAVNKPIKAPSAAAQPASAISEGHITKGQLVKRPFPPAGLPQQIIQQKSQTITPLVQSKASTSQTTESVKTLDSTLPLRPAADSVKMLKANDVITLEKAPLAKQIVLDDSPSVSQTTATRSQAGCIPTGTLLKNNAAGQETIQLCRDETTPRDVTPRQLLVSARNIYPVEIFENESSDPPPEHTETSTKKKSAASGFSNAFTALFKSKRRSDDLKPSKSTKDKAKRNVFAKEGRRSKPRMPQTDLSEERPAQQTRQDVVLSQAIKKCSPFGPYTAEGLCFLFVLTIFCLYLDMPIEKFVCYVLAAFYTFCIMRILGFLD